MQINKAKLSEILERLNAGLATDDIIEGSDSICFGDEMLYTFNDRVWVFIPVDVGFSGMVKAERLLKHLKKATPDKEGCIALSKQGSELIITSGVKGKTKAGIPMSKIEVNPGFSFDDELDWFKIPKGFGQAIRQASYYASTNFNKPKLTCIHVKDKIVEASDGQRGYRFELPKKMKRSFLIPAISIGALKSNDYLKFAVDYEANWVFFQTKSGIITALRMPAEREYIDTDFLYEMEGSVVLEFPDNLIPKIDEAIDFIGQEEQYSYLLLKFDGKKNTIKIESSSTHGWFNSKIKFKSDLQLSFFINPFFLKDILKSTFSAKINIDNGLLLFRAEDWQVVINITLD